MQQYLNFPDFQHPSSFRYVKHFGFCAGIFFRLSLIVRLLHEFYKLKSLPASFTNLINLIDLDSGLRLDYNQLKALPEAMGILKHLEILTPHINRIKGLPTTMENLSQLRELDVSFNEVENIPKTFCFAVSMEKLNLANYFADLKTLPRSIRNLENLEELDITNSQIRTLLDSFRLLSKLETFRADETPQEIPPRQIIKLGAQLDNFIHYMATFLSEFVVGLTAVWQPTLVALVTLVVVPLIAAIGAIYTMTSVKLSRFIKKIREVHSKASIPRSAAGKIYQKMTKLTRCSLQVF